MDEITLQRQSDLFMRNFDAEKRKQKELEAAQVNVPDEDGFIKGRPFFSIFFVTPPIFFPFLSPTLIYPLTSFFLFLFHSRPS